MKWTKTICLGTALLCGLAFSAPLLAQEEEQAPAKKPAMGKQQKKEKNPFERDRKKLDKMDKDCMKEPNADKRKKLEEKRDKELEKFEAKVEKMKNAIQKKLDKLDKQLENEKLQDAKRTELEAVRDGYKKTLFKYDCWAKGEDPEAVAAEQAAEAASGESGK